MYLWNETKLAKDLFEGKVSEIEKLKYFVTVTIFGTVWIGMSHVWAKSDMSTNQSIINVIISIFVNIIGLIVTFKSNRDGKEYIVRNICLSVPIWIKVFSIIIVLSAAIGFIGSLTIGEKEVNSLFASAGFTIITGNLYLLVYYTWLRAKLIKVSVTTDANSLQR